MKRFEGKIAIVTGASTGLGPVMSRMLADEGAKLVLMKPTDGLRRPCHRGQGLRRLDRDEVAEDAGLLGDGFTPVRYFDGEEPLVDDPAESVHDPSAIEVNPDRALVLNRVEARPLLERLLRLPDRMAPQSLEERVTGRNPL